MSIGQIGFLGQQYNNSDDDQGKLFIYDFQIRLNELLDFQMLKHFSDKDIDLN